MKNTALIAVPIALIVAAGAWYMVSKKDANPLDFAASETRDGNAVAATVNGTSITEAEVKTTEDRIVTAQGGTTADLDESTRAQVREQALNELISQTLLQQAAAQAEITVTNEEVDTEYAQIRAQFETDDSFAAALTENGIDEATLRAEIERNLHIQKYLEEELHLSTMTATDEEVEAFYTQTVASAGQGSEVPKLDEIHDQIAQFVVQQKQQEAVAAHVAELRTAAAVDIVDITGE